MKKLPKLAQLYFWSLYLFPAALFFSYYPIISLGQSSTMNFELSVALIYLVLFDLISFVLVFKNHLFPQFFKRQNLLFLLFPLYLSLSIFWSSNQIRALLTAVILWLLYFAIFSIIIIGKNIQTPANHRQNIQKSIILPACIISIWCWLQCLLDILNISNNTTLLCAGCVYQTFGFPHPNGFAIEPQFMGNLLLTPTLLVYYLWLKTPKNLKLLFSTFFLTSTLFLIFSRGAIYSFGIALIFLIIAAIIKQKTKRPLLAIPMVCLSFVFTLNIQGVMSAASPTNDTYSSGIIKVVDQLTLGIFHLSVSSSTQTSIPEQSSTQSPSTVESSFSGYVAESTDVRLNLNSVALSLWSSSPQNLIFGVGLGSAGISLYKANLIPDSKEIVQNQYASLLLETGAIGIILLLLTILLLYGRLVKAKHPLLLFAIIIAYATSLFFFAGLPNAIHIYILLPIVYLSTTSPSTASSSDLSSPFAPSAPPFSAPPA